MSKFAALSSWKNSPLSPLLAKKSRVWRRSSFEGLEDRRLLATFEVLNTHDDGVGSLRAAIVSANATLGKDSIVFAIASPDKKIALQSDLPRVSDPLVIDASSQPGYVDRPLVQIDGAAMPGRAFAGLFITAGDSTVRGLSFTHFIDGIFIEGPGGNRIEGNFMGLAPDGTAAGNAAAGIIIMNSAGNTVGGATAGQRNVISGNREYGVRVEGSGSMGNRIQGNFVGTDASGLNARGNTLDGVLVSGSLNTIIGTDGDGLDDSGEMNLLSGNGERGVRLFNASGNRIAGNFIGLALGGLSALPNRLAGVEIDTNSSGNTLGTNGDGIADEIERNVISGNSAWGIRIDNAVSNAVAGNFIGTTADGLHPLGNLGIGLFLSNAANNNRIGTNADGIADAVERNVISGNATNAIQVFGSHRNVVAGNLLGLSVAGDVAIPNGHSGMWIAAGSTENLIGTNDDGIRDSVERNVIAGNILQGVSIQGAGTDRNVVAGNYFGTDLTGKIKLANETGVYVLGGAQGNTIGTKVGSRSGSSAGNVISGSRQNGVLVKDSRTSFNEIRGNLIGLTADGQSVLANEWAGITLTNDASANVIGGMTATQANFISGNKRNGLCIVAGSHSNSVDGNFIGLALDGISPVGNALSGITIDNSMNNFVGVNAGNSIAYSEQAGIAVTGGLSRGNQFSQNRIFKNLGLAIDLGNDGPTANDSDDADSGPNMLQNFPRLVSAAMDGSTLRIAGGLASAPGTPFRLEFFAKQAAGDAIDQLEYLGFGKVTTDRTGQVNWVIELASTLTAGRAIVATASQALAGTSELSASARVQSYLPVTIAVETARENTGAIQATVSRGSQALNLSLLVSLISDNPALAQVPASVVIPAGLTSTNFEIVVVDDARWRVNQALLITARLGDEAVGTDSVLIVDDDSPWHNFSIATDVSGNGVVSPLDALLVINLLNISRGKSISELAQPSDGSKLFADTNNDEVISPLDALLVINQLNNRSRGAAEGEAAARNNARLTHAAASIDLALLDWDYRKRRR
jgi:hypothetical protein